MGADDSPAIRTSKLSRRFGDLTAVDCLTLEIERGEIFGLVGPNGAGKSTTIRILCGLLQPSEGRAMVGGFDVSLDPEGVKRNIGYMSQKFSLYDDLILPSMEDVFVAMIEEEERRSP